MALSIQEAVTLVLLNNQAAMPRIPSIRAAMPRIPSIRAATRVMGKAAHLKNFQQIMVQLAGKVIVAMGGHGGSGGRCCRGCGGHHPTDNAGVDNVDQAPVIADFAPARPPGFHTPEEFAPENELSFFKLFFLNSCILSKTSLRFLCSCHELSVGIRQTCQ